LYDAFAVPPPHPVAESVNEYVAALVGVPDKITELALEDFIVTPVGSDPDVSFQV
jgi:hypothetical protein